MEELESRSFEVSGEPMPDLLLSYSVMSSGSPDLGLGNERLKTLRDLVQELDEKQALLDASINLLEATASTI